ncbi:complex I subunit 5 family protein [Nesterenkonia sandarakina]|uniref:Multicomponent Na+:H+ antiporter subunit D n=1 Tax=Nesterenkonia sandarakina TaxID=272918 RepID=A0A7Z0J347_9MICC|nr:proton-conducting transporter membrane subunit [Nesterenkonia sandarakina]NYJ16444.1 multicomponent Na+:H+ antiporter subunit D [Nesterenkonia sandarakina]
MVTWLEQIPAELLPAIPVVMVLLSLTAAVAIFPLPENSVRLRAGINLTAAVVKVLLIIALVPAVVADGARPEFTAPFLPGIDLVLRVDPLALFFAGLSALLWLLTTIYALGYLRGSKNKSRFFGFFSLCVTATVGISFSGNLITFLVFYELLTVVTYPLVAHWGTPASLRAARIYLRYALGGGLAVLVGVVWLTMYVGPVDFADGGAEGVAELVGSNPVPALLIFVLLVGGLGVKAALFPLHGWLPLAMVAPAPVSALLHAVAVVKAGVFGIVRVLHDVFGVDAAAQLGVLTPLLILAAFTILYGSYQALRQQEIKKRLAYSTVSQVSYVVLGVAMVNVLATTGGVVHLVHQGLMKVTLFFCAGLFAEVIRAHTVTQLRGAGRRMPLTSTAFTVGALGMIGLPPTAGFISKWQLGTGAMASEHPWVLWVLVGSSLLNAAYFLPVVYALWFVDPEEVDPETLLSGDSETADSADPLRVREPKSLLIPALSTAVLTLLVGIGASLAFAPLQIARFIAEGVLG